MIVAVVVERVLEEDAIGCGRLGAHRLLIGDIMLLLLLLLVLVLMIGQVAHGVALANSASATATAAAASQAGTARLLQNVGRFAASFCTTKYHIIKRCAD